MTTTESPDHFFRVSHAKDHLGVTSVQARKWAEEPDGPPIYKNKKQRVSLCLFSEWAHYIKTHSEVLKKGKK